MKPVQFVDDFQVVVDGFAKPDPRIEDNGATSHSGGYGSVHGFGKKGFDVCHHVVVDR